MPEGLTPEQLGEMADRMGAAFAERLGTPSPERELEAYRNYEEFGTAFTIAPGQEPRFMVLYEHNKEEWNRQRKIWEARAVFTQARAQKMYAASVDSVANPVDSDQTRRLDPLGVEFKKEKLEFIYRNMPGLIAAKSIYTTIIGGENFVGYTPGERDERRRLHMSETAELMSVREALLSPPDDSLRGIYTEREMRELANEYNSLFSGTDNDPACPESLYGAKEQQFNVIRKSIRYFLKTKGVNVLFLNEADSNKILYPGNDYNGLLERKTEGETVLDRMSTRARDAEQVAWNFIFATGMIESFNIPESNQYIREHNKKPLGPSNFMTLYLWMMIHPQQRFEAKVLQRGFDGGEDDAKENWSSLGTWAANNIQKGTWKQQVINPRTGQRETRTVIPKFIRPDVVYDAMREEGNVRAALFDFFTEKGVRILRHPGTVTHQELYNDLVRNSNNRWEKLPESPFVNYRFDRLRWAGAIYKAFKGGGASYRDVADSDLAEAKRKLGLSSQEVMNLLIMREGVDVSKSGIRPAVGELKWGYDLRTIIRNQPDMLRDDSGKRERL